MSRAADDAFHGRGRDQVKRLRELERRSKEQAKLDALEQARLEVETHEARIGMLLSIHAEPAATWNWWELNAALDPCPPSGASARELAERLLACSELRAIEAAALEALRAEDRTALEAALADHAKSQEVRKGRRGIASRVLHGDLDAWALAVAELRPFEELEGLGVTVKADFASQEAVYCQLTVSGFDVIPQFAKTLTSTGKLSTKPMPRKRFHELYQDYVCGCVIRAASEMFSFLPVETVIVTASVGFVEPATGQFGIRPVLSVGFGRAAFSTLSLARVDPSDAIDGFVHRGDAKTSRKTETFVVVEPLRVEELGLQSRHSSRFDDALAQARRAREDVRRDATALAGRSRRAHQPSSTEV